MITIQVMDSTNPAACSGRLRVKFERMEETGHQRFLSIKPAMWLSVPVRAAIHVFDDDPYNYDFMMVKFLPFLGGKSKR